MVPHELGDGATPIGPAPECIPSMQHVVHEHWQLPAAPSQFAPEQLPVCQPQDEVMLHLNGCDSSGVSAAPIGSSTAFVSQCLPEPLAFCHPQPVVSSFDSSEVSAAPIGSSTAFVSQAIVEEGWPHGSL